MGLMDFLIEGAVPFATGALEGLSDKAKAQKEKDAYEDQLKLQNVYSAQAYTSQKQTDFEFLEKEKLVNTKLIKSNCKYARWYGRYFCRFYYTCK